MNNVTIDHKTKIEDQDDSLIVDFANALIGGGTLGRGAAQEEILFLIFPQAIISILICERMEMNETILIKNVRRYADYSGYSSSLQFHEMISFYNNVRKDIIAMDAIQYDQNKSDLQYSSDYFIRELNKCYIAFGSNRQFKLCKQQKISSGKWGCGVFKGDPQMKFLLQWIAASYFKKQLIFATMNDMKKLEQLDEIILALRNKKIKDVFGYLLSYSKGNRRQDLFNFILELVKNETKNDSKGYQINSSTLKVGRKNSYYNQNIIHHDNLELNVFEKVGTFQNENSGYPDNKRRLIMNQKLH